MLTGRGQFGGSGCSGGGHGGTSGRGGNTALTGQPYGHLYEPTEFGSSGCEHYGGRGGGVLWLNVTGHLHNDGSIQSMGQPGQSSHGSGGSGGSIWIYTNYFRGTGRRGFLVGWDACNQHT